MSSDFHIDPDGLDHNSNRDKNDRLSDIMATINDSYNIVRVVRIDVEDEHGWNIEYT